MNKECLLAGGLLLFLLSSASAEIYRCRTSDGRLIMTDNRANLPADCVPIDQPAGSGSFNIVPAPEASEAADQATSGAAKDESEKTTQTSVYDQARMLVQDYNDAVTKRYHAGLVTEQEAAMREITELKRQKEELINGMARSNLSQEERRSVRRLLDRIPRR
jgi:hypothetical protein